VATGDGACEGGSIALVSWFVSGSIQPQSLQPPNKTRRQRQSFAAQSVIRDGDRPGT
jgi:hypothetical protein